MTGVTVKDMTKKIGISLRDDLYEWAAREVEEGRAESVSALIAEGLQILGARAQLEVVVADLRAEIGELDDQAKARLEEALRAADEAYRRHLERRTERVA
jgi:Arc/MetJ-type ribon-helix-helix transcriptional regulator